MYIYQEIIIKLRFNGKYVEEHNEDTAMKWKFSLAGFLCIIAGAVIIPFVTPENPE